MVSRWVKHEKCASTNAKYTNMLVYFALGYTKFWHRVHCLTPTPDARYLAFWWNIGFRMCFHSIFFLILLIIIQTTPLVFQTYCSQKIYITTLLPLPVKAFLLGFKLHTQTLGMYLPLEINTPIEHLYLSTDPSY